MSEDIRKLQDAMRRLNVMLNDEAGQYQMAWFMDVDSLMDEVKDLIDKVRAR
jgi:phage host-nuclease inhibitor protein Gam